MKIRLLALLLLAVLLLAVGCEKTDGDTENTAGSTDTTHTETSAGNVDASEISHEIYSIGNYNGVQFDAATQRFVVLRDNVVDIYDIDMTKLKTISFLLTPECIAADNGTLAVGFGKSMQFRLYSLDSYEEIRTVITDGGVFEMVMDGDMLIYSDDNQWCGMFFYNVKTEAQKTPKIWSIYQPLFDINREDHILYVAETGLSSSSLIYLDSQTGAVIFESQFSQFGANYASPNYDGKFLHFNNATYNRYSGVMESSSLLNRYYNSPDDFTPAATLYDSDDFALLVDDSARTEMAVYNNITEKVVYRFAFNCIDIFSMGNDKYFATERSGLSVAVLCVKIDNSTASGNNNNDIKNGGSISKNNNITTFKDEMYTISAADENYIYLINGTGYSLNVYDINTLEKVYSEKFLLEPICIDAYGGKMVIGYGDGRRFEIFDTTTWRKEVVSTTDCVFSVLLYKNSVIYAPIDQHCTVYQYDILNKKHSQLPNIMMVYYASMAIDRTTDMLYFGDRNSSSCDLIYYDLSIQKSIYTSPFGAYEYNSEPIFFDGNFVHFFGKVFDKTTGTMISDTQRARDYSGASGYTNIATIYDDTKISVFNAQKGGERYVVFYNVASNAVICSFKGVATKVFAKGNSFVVLNNSSNTVYIADLN